MIPRKPAPVLIWGGRRISERSCPSTALCGPVAAQQGIGLRFCVNGRPQSSPKRRCRKIGSEQKTLGGGSRKPARRLAGAITERRRRSGVSQRSSSGALLQPAAWAHAVSRLVRTTADRRLAGSLQESLIERGVNLPQLGDCCF